MKKILLLLLCTVSIYGQTSTGQEQEFDYGIKNNSTQTITTPPYLTTTGMDGTQGKIPSALIEKTDNKQNSLAVDGTGTKYPTVDAVNAAVTSNIAQTITSGVTSSAPSQDVVFDALATKAPISSVHNPVTLGSANGLSLSTQQISLGLASSSTTGALSGTDWNTFNGKFPTPTGLTTNYLPKWNWSGFGNSLIYANENFVGIGTTSGVGSDYFSIAYNSSLLRSQGVNIKDINVAGNNSDFIVFRKDDDTFLGSIRRNSTDSALFVGGNEYLSLGAGNVERMRILANGNVGIGTTSPSAKVTITDLTAGVTYNALALGEKGYEANNFGSIFESSSSTGLFSLYNYTATVKSSNPVLAWSRVNGNVLINTSTDNGIDKLQVNGTISATAGTTANQVVVKSQLDGKVSLTGNETVAGNKTLSGTTTLNETIIREGYQLKFPKGVMYQSSVGTNALTNNRTVSFPDASGTVALVETVRPYKVYTALLSQSGTSAPTATVLENTLGGPIVWTRTGIGQYIGTLTSAFTASKTAIFVTRTNPSAVAFDTNIGANAINADTIGITTFSNSAYVDSQLSNTSIEIRVYN